MSLSFGSGVNVIVGIVVSAVAGSISFCISGCLNPNVINIAPSISVSFVSSNVPM